jgi:hypothetical protein
MRGKPGILRQIPDTAEYRSIPNRFAKQPDFAMIRIRDAERDFNERRLAGAIWTEQSEDRTGLHSQINVL